MEGALNGIGQFIGFSLFGLESLYQIPGPLIHPGTVDQHFHVRSGQEVTAFCFSLGSHRDNMPPNARSTTLQASALLNA